MLTWKRGRLHISKVIKENMLSISSFFETIKQDNYLRVTGIAVFMSIFTDSIPPALTHNLKHNHVLYQEIIILSIQSTRIPSEPRESQIIIEKLKHGFYTVVVKYGFMQTPNVADIMLRLENLGIKNNHSSVTYFLGRETLLTNGNSKMIKLRKSLFTFISKNAQSPTLFFNIPPDRVVEMGMQIKI